MTIAAFTDLSGCEIALVPDAGITLAGSLVSVQADQSGHGRDASIANAVANGFTTATGPTYAASDAAFGSKPSITYSLATDCLATANFGADIAPPWTVITAGRSKAPSADSRIIYDTIAGLAGGYSNIGVLTSKNWGPTDVNAAIWNFTAPVDPLEPRRIVGANLQIPFVLGIAVRSTTFGTVTHNGVVRARRTMIAPAAGAQLMRGVRLGNSSATLGSSALCWIGQLPLFVLYSRELSLSELKDAMLLAGSKCGVSWPAGRAVA